MHWLKRIFERVALIYFVFVGIDIICLITRNSLLSSVGRTSKVSKHTKDTKENELSNEGVKKKVTKKALSHQMKLSRHQV